MARRRRNTLKKEIAAAATWLIENVCQQQRTALGNAPFRELHDKIDATYRARQKGLERDIAAQLKDTDGAHIEFTLEHGVELSVGDDVEDDLRAVTYALSVVIEPGRVTARPSEDAEWAVIYEA